MIENPEVMELETIECPVVTKLALEVAHRLSQDVKGLKLNRQRVACHAALAAFATTVACAHRDLVGRPVDQAVLTELCAAYLSIGIPNLRWEPVR